MQRGDDIGVGVVEGGKRSGGVVKGIGEVVEV